MDGIIKYMIVAASGIFLGSCSSNQPLQTVESVSLSKYQGLWYDVAHLPQRFQDDCKCVTAEYSLQDDYVDVLNTCHDKETGQVRTISGKAFKTSPNEEGELQVQFFWPFKGDYYIIKLEPDYSYAMVGAPDRESLWILSRKPSPAATVLKKYLNYAEELGFDTSRLVYTDQSCYTHP